MAKFSIEHPYLIVVTCLIACVMGLTSFGRMAVDLFPPIQIPVVMCATFYNGMPPQQIEADITDTFERFFTIGSNIDHMTSRSITGVSLIQVYFTPGSNADADITQISNLALADLKRLPEGTLPPVVLNLGGGSSLPVCLLTVKGKGLNQTQLHDYLQYQIRDQIAGVRGATVVPPFGGKYRQVMVYVDPLKLQALQISPMDVVRAVDSSNVILPAGDVRIGPFDYNIYTNSQVVSPKQLNGVLIKSIGHVDGTGSVGEKNVYLRDVGKAVDGSYLQYNMVRVDGQRSVYVPIMMQGGNTSIIKVVDGIRAAIKQLRDIPRQMKASVVFSQSAFVKEAISTVETEGGIGLLLTAIMILIFLGSMRATTAVFLSIPISVLAAIFLLYIGGSTVNAFLLSGIALAFSRLIDNSVIVLENIYRHMELGEAPRPASEVGTNEVAMAVLAITLATIVVFFPVTMLYGVSKFLFMALASGVVLSLIASYFVAVSVVPLYCSKILKPLHDHREGESSERVRRRSLGQRFNAAFNVKFEKLLNGYDRWVAKTLAYPRATVLAFVGGFALSLLLYPFLGFAFFPKTDQGQFMINLQAPTGSRLGVTEDYVEQVENIVRHTVSPHDLSTIVSNIGVNSDFSALFTPNSVMDTAFVQVGLNKDHTVSSFTDMDKVRQKISDQLPELRTYFHSGGLISSVLNQGAPAPIDVQVSGARLGRDAAIARGIAARIRSLPEISDVFIPQGMDYPGLMINVNRTRASELGLTPKNVIDNVITALTSDVMIAPSYWVSPRTGNNYFVTVQYPNNEVKSISDLRTMPLHAPDLSEPTYLDQVATISKIPTPTEVDHYQLERDVDIYVSPKGEDLSRPLAAIQKIVANTKLPSRNFRINIRGLVNTMETSFHSFAVGLILAILLVYLILVAQFKSFTDPFLILLAIPTGLTGVLLILFLSGTTVNIQSLMGTLMMIGMVVSNTILIVDFAKRLQFEEHRSIREAVALACRIRLRPILMTSLATVVGMLAMAFKLEPGSEAYAPLARAIIGGVSVSVLLSIFVIPAAYLLVYRRREAEAEAAAGGQ
jgi:hydrophobic/amphiphilic exporter-1 (mainly G- bacteria), HAE1 family